MGKPFCLEILIQSRERLSGDMGLPSIVANTRSLAGADRHALLELPHLIGSHDLHGARRQRYGALAVLRLGFLKFEPCPGLLETAFDLDGSGLEVDVLPAAEDLEPRKFGRTAPADAG